MFFLNESLDREEAIGVFLVPLATQLAVSSKRVVQKTAKKQKEGLFFSKFRFWYGVKSNAIGTLNSAFERYLPGLSIHVSFFCSDHLLECYGRLKLPMSGVICCRVTNRSAVLCLVAL